MTPCPHCNYNDGVYRNVRASGWCEEFFYPGGQREIETAESLNFTNSQKFYCITCNRQRRDVVEREGQIVLKSGETAATQTK